MNKAETRPVRVYRTPEGAPTCAVNVTKGEHCIGYGTRALGLVDHCLIRCQDLGRANQQHGYTIPLDDCPIWGGTAKPDLEDILFWPCGTWCYREELHEYGWMSDDYRVIPFGSEEYNQLVETK